MATGIPAIFKPDGKNAIHDGIEHEPGGGKALLDPTDTVLLLLDHQSGLFQNVKDIRVAELRANVTALAKLATLHQIPVITTASVPDGPNGPLMPEIHEAAPHAVYVPRKGEVNAWDNALFVKTVRETGKKTLIIAGVWTNVCVMFPALDAKAAGFKVYVVIDASGDPSEMASRTTLARFTQAGIDSDQRQRCHLRSASHLEPPRRRPARRALHDGLAELPGRDGELSEGTGSREEVRYATAQVEVMPCVPSRLARPITAASGPRRRFPCLPTSSCTTRRSRPIASRRSSRRSRSRAASSWPPGPATRSSVSVGRRRWSSTPGGRTVIPGLNDSHLHLIRGGLNYNMELRWDGVPSLADALRMLREQARRTPPPQWVRVVGGWTEFQFAERRMPTLDEINAAAPDTPVFVLHLYDRALLNGAALRAVRLHARTRPIRPAARSSGTSSGNPTGLLIARPNAMILYATLAKGPKLPPEDQVELDPALHARTEPPGRHQRHRRRRRLPELPRRLPGHRGAAPSGAR